MTFNIFQATFKLLWEVNFSGNILLSLTTIWHLCPGLNADVFFSKYFMYEWIFYHFHTISYLIELCVFG